VTIPTHIQDARNLLDALGMDTERSNERSALVLLSLVGLGPLDPWSAAANPMLGTRAIMDWIRDEYEKEYAANTRETIRRFTLHQFTEAHLVAQNPDKPAVGGQDAGGVQPRARGCCREIPGDRA
jgi:hypothetical protein